MSINFKHFLGRSDQFLLTHTPNKIPEAHIVTKSLTWNMMQSILSGKHLSVDFLQFISTFRIQRSLTLSLSSHSTEQLSHAQRT